MKRIVLFVFAALLVHVGVLLFGGALRFLFTHSEVNHESVREVELIVSSQSDRAVPERKQNPQPETDRALTPTDFPDIFAPETPSLPMPDLMPIPSLNPGLFTDTGFGGGGGAGFPFSGSPGGHGKALGDPKSRFDSAPKLLSMVDPTISSSIRKRGGLIVLVLLVNEHGRVTGVDVEKTSDAELISPVVEAVRKWVFEPGMRSGKKSPYRLKQVVRIPAA